MDRRIIDHAGFLFLFAMALFLPGCGGGGGGGGGGASGGSSSSETNGGSSYTVSLSADSLTFNYSIGGTAPDAQAVSATFNGEGLVVGYATTDAEVSWLDIRQADSSDTSSPVDVVFSVDPAGLAAGTYATSVRFVTGEADGDEVAYKDLSLTLVVVNRLSVDKALLTFSSVNGSPTPPVAQAVGIGGDGLSWTATAGEAWITLGTTGGTAPSSLDIGVDPSALTSSGAYHGTVTLQSGDEAATVAVDLDLEPHRLFAEDNGVALASFPTAGSALDFSVVVKDNAGASVAWTASSDQPWLSVTPNGVTGGVVTLTADPTNLMDDTINYAKVTLASTEPSIESGDVITVGFYVASADPDDGVIDSGVTGAHVAADPVRPYVYVTDEGTDIAIRNVYTGSLVGSITAGSALEEMAVSSDGSTLYVIDSGEGAQFPTFVLTDGAIVEGAVLAGGPYPMAAEIGPRGKFYGGRDWPSSTEPNAIDVWSYAANGEPQDTYVLPGHVSPRQLQVSGDGLRLIALTPTLVLSPTAP